MVGCNLMATKKKSCWLNELLGVEFFESCDSHGDYRKNEMNHFCIDCSVGFCKHCSAMHRLHRRLQIFKYVYHNVVRLQEIRSHLDCDQIQTYKSNGENVVHLNSRPQAKDAKPSTKSFCAGSCEACARYIQVPPNRFCSIKCKISVVPLSPKGQTCDDLSPKESCTSDTNTSRMESTLSLAESGDEVPASGVKSALQPKRFLRKRKRKGIPFRAPLF